MVESPENVGELQNDLKKTFHAVVVNQRIYHVIPFVKVTFLLRHRIITRFLAAQSNRACVNYHDDRSKGGGQLDFTINFSPRFAQLARWSREGRMRIEISKNVSTSTNPLSLSPFGEHFAVCLVSFVRDDFFVEPDLYIVVDS